MRNTQSQNEFMRLEVIKTDEITRRRLQGLLEYLIMMAVVGIIAVTVPGLVSI